MSMRCLKKAVARSSPVIIATLLPISAESANASGPQAPRVSIANGTKLCVTARAAYLVRFFDSASTAADPAAREDWRICDGASVSGQVKSHAKVRPLDHGVMV